MPKDTGVVPLSFGGRRCRVRGRASAGGEVVHDSLVGELGERVEANTRIEPPTALSRYATSGDIPARGGAAFTPRSATRSCWRPRTLLRLCFAKLLALLVGEPDGAGPCGATLATAFSSDLRSVDTLRSSLRSPNLTASRQAHLGEGAVMTKNVAPRTLVASVPVRTIKG